MKKIKNCWYDEAKMDFNTFLRLFPKKTRKDFNKFTGRKEAKRDNPNEEKKKELQKNDNRKSKKTSKKISKNK